MWYYIIGGTIIVTGLLLNQKRNIKLKKEAADALRKKKALDFFENVFTKIQTGVFKHAHDSSFQAFYNNKKKEDWRMEYLPLYNSIKGKEFIDVGFSEEKLNVIRQFLLIPQTIDSDVEKHNFDFVPSELEKYKTLFDTIEGRKLDMQQRTAIVKDEDNNLIIAGAGSGKTTTIIGKVNYILKRGFANPNEVLLISFTNDSATTLASRLKNPEIEVKTFHKFGLDVIDAVDGKKRRTIYDENQFTSFITSTFNELVANPDYLKKVTSFFIHYLKPIGDESKFQNQGEQIQFLKDNNYRSYQLSSDRTTYKMEIVKSIEECQIANFFLFNGIDYQYEMRYEHDVATADRRPWKPDFTLIQDHKKIYHEHFGISRSGDVPNFFVKANQTYEQAKAIYNNKITWARTTSEEFGTVLTESYSYEMKEGILFKNLKGNLELHGFELRPKTQEEKWEIIQEANKEDVKQIFKLFGTFITLLKSNNYQIEDVVLKNKSVGDNFTRIRNNLIIELIEPIYNAYQNMLKDKEEIDFSDMINLASEYIISGKYQKKYKYVIVDEFQDISVSRFQLIKAVKILNPDCKTFCVGDDWQSIYRFSGSDITLFKEFEKFFGFSLKSKIETTYRFKDPLIEISSAFIQKNPFQEKKYLKAFNSLSITEYNIVYSTTETQDDTAALKNAFDSILAGGGANLTTFILGRYNFDLNRIKNLNKEFIIDRSAQTVKYRYDSSDHKLFLTAKFMTVHKSKGLEAENIIVLNCNAGRLGFPSQISDDGVLNLLLNESDQFENGEERRLFYVAMTRAKEKLYLVTDSSSKSKFILELEGNAEQLELKKCPNCISADLIKKSGVTNNREWAFWGCSNYVYGCEFQEWI